MRTRPLLITAAVSLVVALIFHRADPQIIHNGSPSVPTGFYRRARHGPAIGDFVTVQARNVAPHYARLRNFSDPSDHFIKRVAALAGAHVCARGDAVTVDETIRLPRATHDRQGRVLPHWSGCRTLREGELFLVGDSPDSFDSRYWGPVSGQAVDDVWVPVPLPAGFRGL